MVCRKLRPFTHKAFVLAALLALPSACSKVDPAAVDTDGDKTPDQMEDRNQNGKVDMGETDPNKVDTDDNGIPDSAEVSTLACAKPNDRPFDVYDVPGADSMLLMDAKVSMRSTLRTMDNKAPGAAFVDPDLDVAAVMVSKRPAPGVAAPSAQRAFEEQNVIGGLGAVTNRHTRALTTVQGFDAEQATFVLRGSATNTARGIASTLASAFLGGVALTGTPPAGGTPGSDMVIQLLTIYRSPTQVVLLAAVAVGNPPSDDALIRLDELTDGTNVARHGSFTRHVCDEFEAQEHSALDIIWMIDDSGSMEDDQMAIREAADAMTDVLAGAHVDYRLGVTRTRAQDQMDQNRGKLEGRGFTTDLDEFKNTVVVGAQGGWEPGLQTALNTINFSMPKTAAGMPADPHRLRDDAAVVVIILSDERDQDVQCAACGGCDNGEHEQRMCTDPSGQQVIDRFIHEYTMQSATVYSIVADLPNGCQQPGSMRNDFEPGQGYVEVANATGGHFASLCGDMRHNIQDIALAATGLASEYTLTSVPASASIRVAKGPPGMGVNIPRSRTNGFDYDPVRNRIIFYGSARPMKGEQVVVGYRRWDWKNNPDRPGNPADGCDSCAANTSCDPTLDTVLCQPICGDTTCQPGQACLPDTAMCGDPNDVPVPPQDGCAVSCEAGMVCNPGSGMCVVPCEQTGCGAGQMCSAITHLCQIPNF